MPDTCEKKWKCIKCKCTWSTSCKEKNPILCPNPKCKSANITRTSPPCDCGDECPNKKDGGCGSGCKKRKKQ